MSKEKEEFEEILRKEFDKRFGTEYMTKKQFNRWQRLITLGLLITLIKNLPKYIILTIKEKRSKK